MDRRLAENFHEPKGRVDALLQFNKITGELVAVLQYVDPDTLNNDYFIYKKIELDFENEEVRGDINNYEIIHKNDLPQLITEEGMDEQARDKITKIYPVVRQVNIISQAILRLSEKVGVEQEELQEMLDYINEVKHANRLRKEFYKNSPDFEFLSYEVLEDMYARQMEGGLHEEYGPRPAVGGRVF